MSSHRELESSSVIPKAAAAFLLSFAILMLAGARAYAEGRGGAYVPGTSGLTLPSLSLSFANSQKPGDVVSVLRIIMMLTVLSLAPRS